MCQTWSVGFDVLTGSYRLDSLRRFVFQTMNQWRQVKYTSTGPCLVEVGSRCHGGEGTWQPIAQECLGYNQVNLTLACKRKALGCCSRLPQRGLRCARCFLVRLRLYSGVALCSDVSGQCCSQPLWMSTYPPLLFLRCLPIGREIMCLPESCWPCLCPLPTLYSCFACFQIDATLDAYIKPDVFEHIPMDPNDMVKTGKEVFLVSKQEGRIASVPGVDIIRGLASFRCVLFHIPLGFLAACGSLDQRYSTCRTQRV